MEPCAFVPTNVTVATGATVTFTNTSGEVHLLTGANQAWGDREREIRPGERVSTTFDSPGVYAFSCALHRGMSGAVLVGDAGDNAAAGLTAPGVGGGSASDSASSGASAGPATTLAFLSLTALAVLGWAVAFAQRRRVRISEAERARASV
jgi:hypothetical protein